jgi:hypothetical protein
MELARILLSAALPTANLLGSWRTLESSQSAGTTSVPPAFYAVATWQLNRCHCGQHAAGILPDSNTQQSAGNRQSKKSGSRRFLKNRIDRTVVRLQRVRHEVHASNKRISVLLDNFIYCFRNLGNIFKHLGTCIRDYCELNFCIS